LRGPDRELLVDAAHAAGRIARRHFKANPKVWDKGGGQGPVTEADLEIDRMLRHELLAARPDHGWLSEESEDNPDRLRARRVFIVDPIDGTRSFVAGRETFAHSLAIAEAGKVVVGVVHLPLLGLTFEASMGAGAACNGKALPKLRDARLQDARILAARPQMAPERWPGGVPPVERHFRSSLAYRLCLVAGGEFDGMVTLRDAWEWDIAAGDLICREAGAVVTSRDGAALTFNTDPPTCPGILAASPSVHAGLMAHMLP